MTFQIKLLKLIKKIIFIYISVILLLSIISYSFYSIYIDKSRLKKNSELLKLQFEEILKSYQDELDKDEIKRNIYSIIKDKNETSLRSLSSQIYRETHIYSNIYLHDVENINVASKIYYDVGSNFDYFINSIFPKKYDIIYSNFITQNSESLLMMKKSINIYGSSIGYITVVIPGSEIQKKISSPDYRYIITDKFDKVLINTIGKNGPVNKYIENFNNKNFIKNITKIYNFKLITFVPTSFSWKNIIIFELIFISLILSILMLMHILTKKSINSTTASMIELFDQIDQLKIGKINEIVVSGDEFKSISSAINKLKTSVEDLTNKTARLEYDNKVSELKRMQSQFNAHFLYNTLELIRTLMYIDIEKTNKLIYDFSSLLRYSLNSMNSIRLEEDITYIEKFLAINKIKYNKNFNYTIDVDSKTASLIVPKLFLQPFIENSIKYGLSKKGYIHIYIECFYNIENNCYIFDIFDTGHALESDILLQLNESLLQGNNSLEENDHHGLVNSINRLRTLFKYVDAQFMPSDGVHLHIVVRSD